MWPFNKKSSLVTEFEDLVKKKDFEKALNLLETTKKDKLLGQNIISKYSDICVKGYATDLFSKSAYLFRDNKYKETRENLTILRKIISKNLELFKIDKFLFKNFCEECISEIEGLQSRKLSVDQIKAIRENCLKRAKEEFKDDSSYNGMCMYIESLIIPALCDVGEGASKKKLDDIQKKEIGDLILNKKYTDVQNILSGYNFSEYRKEDHDFFIFAIDSCCRYISLDLAMEALDFYNKKQYSESNKVLDKFMSFNFDNAPCLKTTKEKLLLLVKAMDIKEESDFHKFKEIIKTKAYEISENEEEHSTLARFVDTFLLRLLNDNQIAPN